jgi:hypothetical protein
MYETPGIDLPWVGTGTGIQLAGLGHLLVFPSWLEHRVEPFEDGERISIAFNAVNP